MHVWTPERHGLPVGDSNILDVNPTAGYYNQTPVLFSPPLINPVPPAATPSYSSSRGHNCLCNEHLHYRFTVSGVSTLCGAYGGTDAVCAKYNRTWTVAWLSHTTGAGIDYCTWEEIFTFSAVNGCNVVGYSTDAVKFDLLIQKNPGPQNPHRLEFHRRKASDSSWHFDGYYSVNAMNCAGTTSFGNVFVPNSPGACTGWPTTVSVAKV